MCRVAGARSKDLTITLGFTSVVAAEFSGWGNQLQLLLVASIAIHAPVVSYHTTPLGAFSLVALYRLAHFCIVSSLHDGMNLVAKEFVAALDDEHGGLVRSALAGAAQGLEDAVIINPYDIDAFATALARAMDMTSEEQESTCSARRVVPWPMARSSSLSAAIDFSAWLGHFTSVLRMT